MTILPELNIKHQVKTENEIDDYLSIFQDVSQADLRAACQRAQFLRKEIQLLLYLLG